ncbi:MAG TPA: hypothetical protein DCE44_10175, partial [Verrucomicrobiales bacterium]|nr:hypothetical protein [Verrucomicrobiales bacterium]
MAAQHQRQAMNTSAPSFALSSVTRRSFLKTGAVAAAGLATLSSRARAQINQNSRLRIFQIGVGGIGGLERSQLKGNPKIE